MKAIALIFLVTIPAQAAIFRNSYVSFEMPDNWKCNLEQTEWVCRSEDGQQSKEAIIILTAKEVGPVDTFEAYTAHLNAAQQISYRNLGTTTSRVIYNPKRVQINDQPWVDGLHLGSEVPSYFTRYLATIKDKIAVLVTFSAHRNKYAQYTNAFFKAVQSLRVIATKNLFNSPDSGPLRASGEALGSGISGAMPSDLEGVDVGIAAQGGRSSNLKTALLAIAVLLGGGGIYVFMKSRR